MTELIVTAALWLLATPIFCLGAAARLLRRRRFWAVSYRATLLCRTCGASISLLGLWHCRCGYTYRGHLLRACPVCSGLPRMARCFACGATELLPQP